MKSIKAIGVFGALALAALSPAGVAGDYMRVHVPFSFVVAGQQFAPGDYVIEQSANGVVSVLGAGKGAMVLSTPGALPGSNAGLRFTNTGQQLNLVSVDQGGVTTRDIPVRSIEQRTITLSSR